MIWRTFPSTVIYPSPESDLMNTRATLAPRAGLLERKSVLSVFQEDDAGGGDVANGSPVIASDVNMLVLGFIQRVPSIEVCRRVSGILANEVPTGEDSAHARACVSSEKITLAQNTYRTAISSTRASGMVPLLT